MRPRIDSPLDEFLFRSFGHISTQVITLDNLATGLASDVSGKLTVFNHDADRRNILFKVSEKNVQIVSSGLLSTSGRNDFANIT